MKIIQIVDLVYILIPAILVIVIQWRWSLKPTTSMAALARMIIQLCLIGYVLTGIFESSQLWLIMLVLSIMLSASSWIALRSVPTRRRHLFSRALLSTLIVNSVILTIISQLILNNQPWFSPTILIPLAGMVFAAGMNSISLFAERYFAEIENNRSSTNARNIAYQATLIPTINTLFAVGVVSLPGMMTGQILSGVSPLIAVRYQIMVMLMLFASSGLTAALFYKLLPSR